MSTLTVSTLQINNIQSTSVTTNTTLTTANTDSGKVVVRSDGGLILNSNSSTNAIVITVGANVGIGNNSPNAKLQVTGTANISGNVTISGTGTISGNTVLSGTANVSGNTVISGTANVSGNLTVSTNTFTLGTSSLTANGYTYLPNGLIFQWGDVVANSTSGNVTFAVAFPTAILQSVCTSNNQLSGEVGIEAQSTTGLQLRNESSTNPASILVRYLAIGY